MAAVCPCAYLVPFETLPGISLYTMALRYCSAKLKFDLEHLARTYVKRLRLNWQYLSDQTDILPGQACDEMKKLLAHFVLSLLPLNHLSVPSFCHAFVLGVKVAQRSSLQHVAGALSSDPPHRLVGWQPSSTGSKLCRVVSLISSLHSTSWVFAWHAAPGSEPWGWMLRLA